MGYDRRRLGLDALTVALAVAGGALLLIGGSPPEHTPYRGIGATQGPPGLPAPTWSPAGNAAPVVEVTPDRGPVVTRPRALGASVPVHLDIPAISLSTSLMALGLNADGTVAVPPLRGDAPAGWYRHLVTPGEVGPAVLLGHVDSARDGPAVFHRLHELHPGDTVTVRRADGSRAVFAVERVVEYPKSAFPSGEVYGALGHPVLRLITCGGTFDRLRRTYRGNVVVYATFTGTAP